MTQEEKELIEFHLARIKESLVRMDAKNKKLYEASCAIEKEKNAIHHHRFSLNALMENISTKETTNDTRRKRID